MLTQAEPCQLFSQAEAEFATSASPGMWIQEEEQDLVPQKAFPSSKPRVSDQEPVSVFYIIFSSINHSVASIIIFPLSFPVRLCSL